MEKNTTEYIGWLLATNNRAVEKAIVVLYNRQTADEKASEGTRHNNGRGFNIADAKKGTYMAKWILAGNHLTGQWLIDAKGIAYKYIGQLVEEATLKMAHEAERVRMEQEAIMSRIDREVAEEKAIIASEALECYENQ